jgi:two-component system sensor histidine kinase TctE
VDLGYEGDEHLTVDGEKLLLREALNNLLDNALIYAGTASVVTVRVTHHDGLAAMDVEDNGPGLSPDNLDHVFERFWRASELPGGCGLGLAIVAEITQRHGGSVQALGVQPHGLLIRLNLPIGQPA